VIFTDREAAGRALAEALTSRVGNDAVVFGIPRGGVVVAAEVARALNAPLDVVVPRKVGAPGNPELGLGAVAPGVRVLDEVAIRALGVSNDYLEREIERQQREIERRERLYRSGAPPAPIAGRTGVVVDDGIATGGTATAALSWVRARGADRVVLAVPVAPAQTARRLTDEADDVVVLQMPDLFHAVGQWYRHFDQVEDDEVIRVLARAAGAPT